jgi:hypothetical protein
MREYRPRVSSGRATVKAPHAMASHSFKIPRLSGVSKLYSIKPKAAKTPKIKI